MYNKLITFALLGATFVAADPKQYPRFVDTSINELARRLDGWRIYIENALALNKTNADMFSVLFIQTISNIDIFRHAATSAVIRKYPGFKSDFAPSERYWLPLIRIRNQTPTKVQSAFDKIVNELHGWKNDAIENVGNDERAAWEIDYSYHSAISYINNIKSYALGVAIQDHPEYIQIAIDSTAWKLTNWTNYIIRTSKNNEDIKNVRDSFLFAVNNITVIRSASLNQIAEIHRLLHFIPFSQYWIPVIEIKNPTSTVVQLSFNEIVNLLDDLTKYIMIRVSYEKFLVQTVNASFNFLISDIDKIKNIAIKTVSA